MLISFFLITNNRHRLLGANAFSLLFGAGLIYGNVASVVTAEEIEQTGISYGTGIFVGSDSNIFRQTDKQSDNTLTVTPQITLNGNYGKHQLTLGYRGKYKKYQEVSSLNFNEHNAELDLKLDHSPRFTSGLTFEYINRIEEPGYTDQTPAALTQFNELDIIRVKAKGTYGRSDSTGQLVLIVSHDDYSYTNNNQSYRDTGNNRVTAQFFYRLAPKTRVLVEAGYSNVNYKDQQTFDLSNVETRVMTGLQWNASAKTYGLLKIGYQTKHYDNDAEFNKVSGLYYSLDMNWMPNNYTQVLLGASRKIRESAIEGQSGFIDTEFSAGVNYAITERTSLVTRYRYSDYQFNDSTSQTNKYTQFDVGFSHSLRRWIDLELMYRRMERTSDNIAFEFDAELIELGTTLSFD